MSSNAKGYMRAAKCTVLARKRLQGKLAYIYYTCGSAKVLYNSSRDGYMW